jgi:hypothetical protein
MTRPHKTIPRELVLVGARIEQAVSFPPNQAE